MKEQIVLETPHPPRARALDSSAVGIRLRAPSCWLHGAIASLLLMIPSLAAAQGQLLGAIHGTVTDQQGGVLPGTLITATPTESRPPMTATTNASGYYILRGLPPGEYSIAADLAGFVRILRPGIVARAGVTLSVDVAMTLGGVDELVTVKTDTPLLDTVSAATAVNISGDFQRALPTSQRRNWSDALIVSPGVVASDSTLFASTTQLYFVHGSSSSSHVIQLDGADMSTANTGAGSPHNVAFNTDVIADVRVATAGVDASAPLGNGAIINVTTRSGTNDLSGAVGALYQAKRWNSSNSPGGTSAAVWLVQPEFSLGGPIVRDRLWYFAAFRRNDAARGVSRTPAQIDVLRQLDSSFVPFELKNEGNLFFAKFTSQASPSQRLSTFLQSDPSRYDTGTFSQATPGGNRVGGRAFSGRLSSTWGASVTSELSVSYNDKTFESAQPQDTSKPLIQVFSGTTLSSGRLLGTGLLANIGAASPTWSTSPSKRSTITFDVNYFKDSAVGAHDFKFGVFAQPRTVTESFTFRVNGGEAMSHAVLRDSNNPAAGFVVFRKSNWPEQTLSFRSVGSNYAVYLQDTWRLKRLTATLGLRVDRVAYFDDIFNVSTQRSIDLGPRVGLNYALTSEARSVARFSWSRVPDRAAAAAFAGSVTATETRVFDLNLDGTFETSDLIAGTNSLARNRVFADDIHQSYVNELTVGYRQQFAHQLAIDIGLVRRAMKDTFTGVEINGIYENSRFRGYLDESQTDVYKLMNNQWNWPVYTALELVATQRTSRTDFIASYTRQWQRIDGTWQPNDPASFIQPGAFANNRGIGNPSGGSSPTQANSLSGISMSVTAFSDLPWHDHVLRAGGNVQLPFRFAFGAVYTYQAGGWSGPIVQRLAAADPAFGPATVTLSNGRSVPNPLATVVRFAYPTRGEGQFRLDALQTFNIKLSKTLSLARGNLEIAASVHNLTNNDTNEGLMIDGNVLGSSSYGVGTNRQPPRAAQISCYFRF